MREPFEHALGIDLAGVRVHPDSPLAGGTTRALNQGDDLHFGEGQYQPDTEAGRELIGHELIHREQRRLPVQGEMAGGEVSRQALEQEAQDLGERAARGERVRPVLSAAAYGGQPLRFDSFEHMVLIDAGARHLGGTHSIVLKGSGLRVTAGEVGALMKDFFSRFEYLDACPRERLEPLVRLIHRQLEQARAHGGRPTEKEAAANEEEAQRLTAYREEKAYDPKTETVRLRGAIEGGETKSYFSLALENSDHFFGLNVKESLEMIGSALNLQLRASRTQGAEREELERQAQGMLYASFHGLTDALSAGHLLDAKEMRNVGKQWWQEAHPQILGHLTSAVMTAYPSLVAIPLQMFAPKDSLKPLLQGIFHRFLDKRIESLFLKLEHDRLNRLGLRIVNSFGQAWLAFGDDQLTRAPMSVEIGQRLVLLVLSRFEIFKTKLSQGQKVNMVRVFSDIETGIGEMLPRYVEWGGQYIRVEDFAGDGDRYLTWLKEMVLQDDPKKNALCQLVINNAGVAGQSSEQWLHEELAGILAQEESNANHRHNQFFTPWGWGGRR